MILIKKKKKKKSPWYCLKLTDSLFKLINDDNKEIIMEIFHQVINSNSVDLLIYNLIDLYHVNQLANYGTSKHIMLNILIQSFQSIYIKNIEQIIDDIDQHIPLLLIDIAIYMLQHDQSNTTILHYILSMIKKRSKIS